MHFLTRIILIILVSAPTVALAESEATGKQLYNTYCTQCHGIYGDGWGVNTRDIEVLPRDHTDSGEMSARSDEELFKAIKHGGQAVNKSILMPNWDATMSDAEIDRVVRYLRELCNCDAP